MKINPFEIKRLVKEASNLDLSALNYNHSRDKNKPGRQGSYTGRYSPQGIARQRGLANLKKFRESNPDIGYDDLNDAQRRQLDNLGMQGGNSQDVMGLWDSLQPESAESLAQRTQERADAQFPPVGTSDRREADRKRLLAQTSINSLDELNNPGASATRDMARDRLSGMRREDAADNPFNEVGPAGPLDGLSSDEISAGRGAIAEANPGMSPKGVEDQFLRDTIQDQHYKEKPWTDPEYKGLSSASGSALLRPYLAGELDPATAKQFEQYGGVSDLDKRKYEYDRYNTVVQSDPNAPRGYLGGRHGYEFADQYGPSDYAAAPSAPRPPVGTHANQDTGAPTAPQPTAPQPAAPQPAAPPRMAGQHHQGQTYDQVMQTARSRGLQLSSDGRSWVPTQPPAGAPPAGAPPAGGAPPPAAAPQQTQPKPTLTAKVGPNPLQNSSNLAEIPPGPVRKMWQNRPTNNPYQPGSQTGPSSIRPGGTLPGTPVPPRPAPTPSGSPPPTRPTTMPGNPITSEHLNSLKQPTNAPPIFKGQVFE